MINTAFLRTFMSLVNTRHFTQTAEQLHMTQPGVSQHIKKLEAQLGKNLLNRHGKSFELTSAGESLYEYGLRQRQAEVDLKEKINEDNLYTGECRIACSGSMALQLYPKLLELQSNFPKLSFSVEVAPNPRIIDLVQSNQYEMGLITQLSSNTSLNHSRLGEEPLYLVLPHDAKSDWSSLVQLGFINHPDGHHYAIQVLEENYAKDFQGMDQFPQRSYINQLGQILLPVSKGLGFTIIPKAAVDAFPYPHLLRTAKLKKQISEPIYLVTKKHRPLATRYQLITELLNS